jgi:hypothetical protein
MGIHYTTFVNSVLYVPHGSIALSFIYLKLQGKERKALVISATIGKNIVPLLHIYNVTQIMDKLHK